jgi:hypothetical protein
MKGMVVARGCRNTNGQPVKSTSPCGNAGQ